MGQSEIQKILEENKGKLFSISDIKLILNQESPSISRALNKMLKYGEVKRKKIKKENTEYDVSFWYI